MSVAASHHKNPDDQHAQSVPMTQQAADSTLLCYRWLHRKDIGAQLQQAQELLIYGNRFRVLRLGDELLFDDRFWPAVGASPIAALPCDLDDARELLLWGFGQPTLEIRPDFIASTKRFSADVNFWQYPCRTEGEAFAVHRTLDGPQIIDGTLQIYLGMPWATWIDRNSHPEIILKTLADRLAKLRAELQRFEIYLQVHTVCQHILWHENLHIIKAAGVNCLWLSHKPDDLGEIDNLKLHPWHLYAVNAREADRRDSLVIRTQETKPWLASFIGAHMKHYITRIRPKLLSFQDLDGFYIELKNEWHFNPIVYGDQVEDGSFWNRSKKTSVEECIHYNKVLSSSIFSLCPAGAGTNSLRLWESLSVGSIPVILSDHLVLPDLNLISGGRWDDWNQIVLLHPENDLDSLPERLKSMDLEDRKRRSETGIALMELINRFTCLGQASNRTIGRLQQESGPEESGCDH